MHTFVCVGTIIGMMTAPAWAQDQVSVHPEIGATAVARSNFGNALDEPGCAVPDGYDCTTPGFETPLTLDEAIELSKTETVVYLYGKGLWDARIVADVISGRIRKQNKNRKAPAVAVPGIDVPDNALHVVILGKAVRHKSSQEPVSFYQKYLNSGQIFPLTYVVYEKKIEAKSQSSQE